MIYSPSTKIDFGVHKGFEISKIYQFDPSYLDWAIKYVPMFEIDLTEFEKLPKSTPYNKTMSVCRLSDLEYGYYIDSIIPEAETYVQAGNELEEVSFSFSEFSKTALKQKQEGEYVCPKYERVKLATVKVEDIF